MKLEPIDTSTTAGKARVMQLAAEGRKVASISKSREDWAWAECHHDPAWMWMEFDYAIIGRPVGPDEVWVTVVDGKTAIDVYPTQQMAAAGLNRGWEAVRYLRAEE